MLVCVIAGGSSVGCKKGLQKTTPLPGRTASPIGGGNPTGPLDVPPVDTAGLTGADSASTAGGIPLSDADRSGWIQDRNTFAAEIVYFDFDKFNIRPDQVHKIETVAAMFKSMSGKALLIEGHCDERGTEEYNRALGERRALSVREYLAQMGVDAQLVDTVSFGEDRPVDVGHDESAWSLNRRGEFVVLSAPGSN